VVANGDPLNRFITAVAWDGYANLSAWQTRTIEVGPGVTPKVPTQFQQQNRKLSSSAPHSAGPQV